MSRFSTPEVSEAETRGNGFLTAKERRQHRIDHGMCPECGGEAAPYYLCWDCRSLASITKMLNRGVKLGVFTKQGTGKHTLWGAGARISDKIDFGATYLWDMNPDDKRLRPRINRRPGDLDETLMGVFMGAGKPLTMEEIYMAWGALRSKRRHQTLATDMTAIIKAQRKRDMRAAKRVAIMAPHHQAQLAERERMMEVGE